jgi:hypothetical protein
MRLFSPIALLCVLPLLKAHWAQADLPQTSQAPEESKAQTSEALKTPETKPKKLQSPTNASVKGDAGTRAQARSQGAVIQKTQAGQFEIDTD